MADDFDGYRKWLGISDKKRPPTHYDLLGISLDEDDPEVIHAAAEQRRRFVESKRGDGHDKIVTEILYRIDESEATLLNNEMRRGYDRQLDLFGKRQKSRQVDPNAPRSRIQSRPGPTVGEGTGFVSTFAGIVAVLCVGFGIMAWFSFQMPWAKLEKDADVGQSKQQIVQPIPSVDMRGGSSELDKDPVGIEDLLAQELGGATKRVVPEMTENASTNKSSSVAAPSIQSSISGGKMTDGNIALSSRGAIITGVRLEDSGNILDGRSKHEDGYGKGRLNIPIVITLPDVYQIRLVRMNLIPAWLPNNSRESFYRYKLEVSGDGISYETVADRTDGRHRDWQDIEFSPRPVKIIRLTGTHDNPNQTGIRIAELEAYCTIPVIESRQQSSSSTSAATGLNSVSNGSTVGELLPKPILYLSGQTDKKSIPSQLAVKREYGVPTEGKIGGAIRFDGKGIAEVSVPLPIGNAPRSLAVWIRNERKTPSKDLKFIIVYGNVHKSGEPFGLMEANGKWRFYDLNGGVDSGVPVDRAWHHHCVTFDGRTINYYVDGTLRGSIDRKLSTTMSVLSVGGWLDGNNMIGVLDELSVFDTALTPEQVQESMTREW